MIEGTVNDLSSAVASATTAGNISSPSSDQFLRLLITQLRNQDPLNPVNDKDFTAQLAQFSSLEKLSDINSNLVALGGIQQGLVNAQALNLLGHDVLVPGSAGLNLASGSSDTIVVDRPATATSVKVEIRDADGVLVRTLDVPAGTGRAELAWDGKDESGVRQTDGTYSGAVVATDGAGESIPATALIRLVVDGVSFAGGNVHLTSGGREVPFDQIVEIQAT